MSACKKDDTNRSAEPSPSRIKFSILWQTQNEPAYTYIESFIPPMSEEDQEFDKYGRKIRKGFKIDLLPAVVLIAFFGGITAVIMNENQPGTSDSPKTEAYATSTPTDNIIHIADDGRVYTDCFSARDDSCDATPLIEIKGASFNRVSNDVVVDIGGTPFCTVKSAESQNISMGFCTTRGWRRNN